ncbi:YjbA family protein [Halalkalibacter urbisdiaboli]|uniref:YjbA family protein n=1 Tax=Halalkalibacter urbisdiaboli TaxID=1960589 RepID=UPI000B4322AD|nr:YjbA family protein [Halalkalibacter urbisdiaboli]
MVHIRDVWVNWFEGEENGYNVCSFFEWRPDDRIEILDQAILVKVSTDLFNYIENDIAELPDRLLDAVHNQSFLRKNMSRIQLDYCFIATDGSRIIAVDTMGYKTPIRKSRLTPRQERMVYELLVQHEFERFDLEDKVDMKGYHILSPSPEDMLGLTRKERQLKQLLYMALDQLYTSGHEAEVRYWCTEWAPHDYQNIQHMERDEAWRYLFQSVKEGWTSRHYQLCEAMVKGQSFLEKLWELEQGESVK